MSWTAAASSTPRAAAAETRSPGERAAWVDACGQAYKGHRAGIAVFPHASTADSPWGVADYGTITVNPIFESSWELDPGDSVEAGVSLVVHDGSTGDAGIAEKYHSFQRRMM